MEVLLTVVAWRAPAFATTIAARTALREVDTGLM